MATCISWLEASKAVLPLFCLIALYAVGILTGLSMRSEPVCPECPIQPECVHTDDERSFRPELTRPYSPDNYGTDCIEGEHPIGDGGCWGTFEVSAQPLNATAEVIIVGGD